MLGVIDILVYGLARHAELFCNLGVADAFSMQFQNLYGLVGGQLCLAARIARIWISASLQVLAIHPNQLCQKFLLFAFGNRSASSIPPMLVSTITISYFFRNVNKLKYLRLTH